MYDRRKTIGASDAVHIQAGKWAELYDRKHSPDEAQYGLAAELGKRLEPFNLDLYERETGRQVFVDDDWGSNPMRLAAYPWCTYLPDGLLRRTADDDLIIWMAMHASIKDDQFFIPIEAKCINMMWKPHLLLTKYMPQLQHAMRVARSPYCIFSVIYLNTRYEWSKIKYDEPYDAALFKKEKLFQWFLEQNIRPPEYLGKRKGWI